VNRAALAVGMTGVVVVILVLKRFWRAVPGVMVAVLVGIAAVAAFDLDEEGVKVLGVLPKGLPQPAAGPAPVDAGRDRHHLGHRPDRGHRRPAAVPGPPLGVRPLAGRVRWRRPARGADGHLRGHPAVAGRLRPPGLAPHDAVLGREDALKGYHDIDRHPSARLIPRLLLYRFDAPLFFASAGYFRRRVLRLVSETTHPVRWVVVAAEPITDIDTTAADNLLDLLEELRSEQVTLAFAELKGPVKDRLRNYGLYDAVGDDRFFPTVGTAVNGYIDATGTTWVDWEERPTPARPAAGTPAPARPAAGQRHGQRHEVAVGDRQPVGHHYTRRAGRQPMRPRAARRAPPAPVTGLGYAPIPPQTWVSTPPAGVSDLSDHH